MSDYDKLQWIPLPSHLVEFYENVLRPVLEAHLSELSANKTLYRRFADKITEKDLLRLCKEFLDDVSLFLKTAQGENEKRFEEDLKAGILDKLVAREE